MSDMDSARIRINTLELLRRISCNYDLDPQEAGDVRRLIEELNKPAESATAPREDAQCLAAELWRSSVGADREEWISEAAAEIEARRSGQGEADEIRAVLVEACRYGYKPNLLDKYDAMIAALSESEK